MLREGIESKAIIANVEDAGMRPMRAVVGGIEFCREKLWTIEQSLIVQHPV